MTNKIKPREELCKSPQCTGFPTTAGNQMNAGSCPLETSNWCHSFSGQSPQIPTSTRDVSNLYPRKMS